MSAITGIMQRHGSSVDLAQDLQHALSALASYGPEGCQYWIGEQVGLGHQHMVITPEDTLERLPWYDAASGLVITADVRLDNRADVGAALGISPPEGVQLPDSALILHAYQKWGTSCPAHLLGDFAFAIWDTTERLLFCARDHIGSKPFYYCLTRERCVVASDINGVLAVPGVSQRLHDAYVAAYLQEWKLAHHALTFFEAIRKLPPAHTLTVRGDACRLERYWYPDRLPDVHFSSDRAYAEAFLDIYTQAVETRLRSIHPVGVHVSGGLDSSSVAVLAARAMRRQGKPLEGFCWAPPPQGDCPAADERRLVQAVCTQAGLPLHYQCLTVDGCIALLQRDVTREPTLDTLTHEDVVQQQAAARQIRVLLSGWGGDEFATFSGLGYYPQLVLQGRWYTLYRELRAAGGNIRKGLLIHGLLPLMPAWCQTMVASFRPQLIPCLPFQSYIRADFASRMRREGRTLASKPVYRVGIRRTQLQLLQLGHLTQRIEDWAANAARYRIVYGYPLLDRRLVEFALGLPPECYFHAGQSRRVARQALAGLLPSAVVQNHDKTDPVRSQQLQAVVSQALTTRGQQLAASSRLPARAEYMDMPRLLRRLTSGEPMAPIDMLGLWHAVQFLGG